MPAADQCDGAALLGQLGCRLDSGQAGADDGHRGIRVQLVEGVAQPLCQLEFRYRVGEFGCTRHGGRCRTGAADRVDEVVVVQSSAARRQLHGARGGVDPGGTVDDQLDAVAEQRAVVRRGDVIARDELVQPDPLDELRPRVHQRDVDVGAKPQIVGRQRSGVSAADDDDVCALAGHGVSCSLGCALKTPPSVET